jgi:tetratricopeptide (TPR) repeat protein
MQEILRLKQQALYYEDVGDYDKAEALFSRAVALKERSLGADHLAMAEDLHKLGLLNLALNDHMRAEELLGRALSIKRQNLGADHPDVIETMRAIDLARMDLNFAESA